MQSPDVATQHDIQTVAETASSDIPWGSQRVHSLPKPANVGEERSMTTQHNVDDKQEQHHHDHHHC